MCMYCERRQDVKFGWEQPKLPWHNNMPYNMDLGGNVLANDRWEGDILDYQTTTPILRMLCKNYFGEGTTGTIQIPIKYCPECGRKLGKNDSVQKDESLKKFVEDNSVSEGFLQDWYQSSILDTDPPVWTDEHIAEVYGDFYLIPKETIDKSELKKEENTITKDIIKQ